MNRREMLKAVAATPLLVLAIGGEAEASATRENEKAFYDEHGNRFDDIVLRGVAHLKNNGRYFRGIRCQARDAAKTWEISKGEFAGLWNRHFSYSPARGCWHWWNVLQTRRYSIREVARLYGVPQSCLTSNGARRIENQSKGT